MPVQRGELVESNILTVKKVPKAIRELKGVLIEDSGVSWNNSEKQPLWHIWYFE